jgi:hypothetical protein
MLRALFILLLAAALVQTCTGVFPVNEWRRQQFHEASRQLRRTVAVLERLLSVDEESL